MTKVETKISWADFTFNPWVGCMKVTDGCKNCYAETMNKRFNGGKNWGPDSERRTTNVQNWNQVTRLNRECKALNIRKVVFCASLADVFEDNDQVIETRARLWQLIESCDHLDWLLLTKRPQNIRRFIPESWKANWPSNVMPGVSVCGQNDRVLFDHIAELAHNYRFEYFLSMEPLLSAIPLYYWVSGYDNIKKPYSIITGGESGPHARPLHPEWIRKIKDCCQHLGIIFHFKQWGEYAEACKDLEEEGGHKILYVNTDGSHTENYSGSYLNDNFVKMVRYGVKYTGNRLDGEHYMPKIFFQNGSK